VIYSSNIRKVVNNLEKGLRSIVDDKLMIEIGSTVQANTLERIHEDGLDSNLRNIGSYDTTTPIYINPDKAPRKTANKAKGIEGLKRAGKYGDTKFKNGKPHKTAYNANYKALRNKIGRRIDKVDLNFSGKLSKEFGLELKAENQVDLGFLTEYGTTISEGLETKYGKKIWDITDNDIKDINTIINAKIKKQLNA
jgi:hypothetical protein